MSNHYPLFFETPRGNLSQIMRHINGAYTIYYNVKHKHVGHLFQGRYMAIVVDADRYALESSRYVHLNPVRAGIIASPQDYRWSSYSSFTKASARLRKRLETEDVLRDRVKEILKSLCYVKVQT